MAGLTHRGWTSAEVMVRSKEKISVEGESERFGESVRAIAARLRGFAVGLDNPSLSEEREQSLADVEQTMLVSIAEAEYVGRRTRQDGFPVTFFGEPAWDILLDLFIKSARQIRVSISNACWASGVPATTALRWIAILEAEGYVGRSAACLDKRVYYLHLTDKSTVALSNWLRQRAGIRSS